MNIYKIFLILLSEVVITDICFSEFKRVLINLKINGETPKFAADGMTIDSDGFLYVVLFGASKVLKINPK